MLLLWQLLPRTVDDAHFVPGEGSQGGAGIHMELDEDFRRMDADSNGFISEAEASIYFEEDEVTMYLMEADADGDGQIDYMEFFDQEAGARGLASVVGS